MNKTRIPSILILPAAVIVLFGFLSPAYPQQGEPILTIEMGIHSTMIREVVADP